MLHGACACVGCGCGILLSGTGITGPLVFRHTWPCLTILAVDCASGATVMCMNCSCDDHPCCRLCLFLCFVCGLQPTDVVYMYALFFFATHTPWYRRIRVVCTLPVDAFTHVHKSTTLEPREARCCVTWCRNVRRSGSWTCRVRRNSECPTNCSLAAPFCGCAMVHL